MRSVNHCLLLKAVLKRYKWQFKFSCFWNCKLVKSFETLNKLKLGTWLSNNQIFCLKSRCRLLKFQKFLFIHRYTSLQLKFLVMATRILILKKIISTINLKKKLFKKSKTSREKYFWKFMFLFWDKNVEYSQR